MALFEGDNWTFTVEQWWFDEPGGEVYNEGEPDWDQLAIAHTLTGHIEWYDDDGNVIQEKYLQLESDDGFYESELEADVDDAVAFYE